MVIAALVPRSFKQLFLLGLGGGLLHRDPDGECGFYQAAGIDTAKGSLLGQVNDKVKDKGERLISLSPRRAGPGVLLFAALRGKLPPALPCPPPLFPTNRFSNNSAG